MYGYRNGLLTNLNSISSSLSSIETIGRRSQTIGKSSVDNLIIQSPSHSMPSTGASYNIGSKDDPYSTMSNVRNSGSRYQTSDIYYSSKRRTRMSGFCPNPHTALIFTLIPLLLLTILRQIFDFLGQIWLQILINFFTILIIIIALFGIRQSRSSYLIMFIVWALFNTAWNLLVIVIHSKMRDINLNEDFLSMYTGAISWWHLNGPGCLPYTFTAPIQHQSVSILKPNIITGCRIDYHLLESTQAALHASLSLVSSLICCFTVWSFCRQKTNAFASNTNSNHQNGSIPTDKPYRMNDLTKGRTLAKINHNPYPTHGSLAMTETSRFVSSGSTALRRSTTGTNKRASSRSSQHSLASARLERRRNRQTSDAPINGPLPTTRGSTSSGHRSQKYGSLSSRRSKTNRRIGPEEHASLTYGSTSANARSAASGPTATTASQRARQSSLSSADYLPSYQPPHSSSANLLSSYGEISSIDSYNNRVSSRKDRSKFDDRNNGGGNTNPTYTGSRSSICSQTLNNYDDISKIYGNSRANNNGSVYGASTISASDHSRYLRGDGEGTIGAHVRSRTIQANVPKDIRAEIYKVNGTSYDPNGQIQQQSRAKGFAAGSASFQSFSSSSQLKQPRTNSKEQPEMNNNHLASNCLEHIAQFQ